MTVVTSSLIFDYCHSTVATKTNLHNHVHVHCIKLRLLYIQVAKIS